MIDTAYKPVTGEFYDLLKELVAQKKYVQLEYFSDIHEFLKVRAVAKEIVMKNEMEFLNLNTGEGIRLDQVVRVEKVTSPLYAHFDNFSCDC